MYNIALPKDMNSYNAILPIVQLFSNPNTYIIIQMTKNAKNQNQTL